MVNDNCEECNQELDYDNNEGLCQWCKKSIDEAAKDREFDEKLALGYLS